MSASHRAARAALAVASTMLLAGLLAGCGGFGSTPPAAPDRTIRSYVALGDDFTAAPGVGDDSADDGCGRSNANYPALLAKDLHIDDVDDVSCVGATTESLTAETRPAKDAAAVPAQIRAVGKGTDLVTLGIGIADRDLLSHAFALCEALPCGEKVPPQTVLDDLDALGRPLTSAVRAVQDRAPRAYIVLVGYPKIAPDTGSCRALPDLDQPALDAANSVLEQINSQVQSVARETGAAFLDVAQLSSGHDVCASVPWVERTEKTRSIRFHPVAAEQRAVAEALEELVRHR